jgi:TPP-dependent pyruvate/acetoin dehydrogenase alpha subunit
VVDTKLLARVEHELNAEIKAALQFALDAPYPDARQVDRHVYA